MPNWCECDLTVRGSAEDVVAFVKRAKVVEKDEDGKEETACLSQDAYIPMPAELNEDNNYGSSEQTVAKKAEMKAKYGSEDGYSWQTANWGVKWGICKPSFVGYSQHKSTGTADYTFETPWGPPMKIIDAMAAAHPKVEFQLRYFEAAMQFNGQVIWQNGRVMEHTQGVYFGNRGG